MPFDHARYRTIFLANHKAHQPMINDSVATVAPYIGSSPYFKLIGIHHLTPDENRSKRNLYLEVIDLAGNRLNERIYWGWNGQRPNEHPNPVTLDKPANEPAGNISIDAGQVVWAQILSKPSDMIRGVRTNLPDEGSERWNSIGHHSYYAVWLFVDTAAPPAPPPPGGSAYEQLQAEHQRLLNQYQMLQAFCRAFTEAVEDLV